MFGKKEVYAGGLRFRPDFPLQVGIPYFVVLNAYSNESIVSTVYSFTIPADESPPVATVTEVFPTASELPANLLKFYLHFSHPMSVGDSYRHIRLLDDDGEAVDLPFLELGEELWDRDAKRLTLLFDPGRIKSGLKPRMEVGMALREGERYMLQILDTWLDAEGRPLVEGFQKPFVAIDSDVESPVPERWKLHAPKASTRNTLIVELGESLDEALLQRVIGVIDSRDNEIGGVVSVANGEQSWSFVPDDSWKSGAYRLEIQTILEDLAGNSVGRPFEVEIRREEKHLRPPRFAYLDFVVE